MRDPILLSVLQALLSPADADADADAALREKFRVY